jgi:hypothetical protein
VKQSSDHARIALPLAVILLALGVALRLHHILAHFDVDWEPDSYQHVLMAKSALAHATGGFWIAIDPWAKPLFTLLATSIWAVIPHHWPLIPAVQMANATLWIASVVLVASVAHRESRGGHPGLIVLALGLFSFVAFRESVSALTEPSGAILIAAGLFAYAQRRPYLAILGFGLAGLARLDALLLAFVAVLHMCAEVARREDLTTGGKLARILTLGTVAVAPVATWEGLGLLHGGPIRYILGSYAGAGSPYGHGGLLSYVHAFALADPLVVLGALGAGALALFPRNELPRTIRLAALQALIYFVVLSLMWSRGAMGLAGLLRYFVVAYPAFLLATGWLLDTLGQRLRPGWASTWVTLAIVLAVQGFELRRLYLPPVYEDNEITSLVPSDLGSYPYRQLSALRERVAERTIIADRPEVLYYLGATHSIYDSPKTDQVRDPRVHGIFGFVRGWSEGYGMHLGDFDSLTPVAQVAPGIYLFERP